MSHNSANMFSGYNKTGKSVARVGNWVEELALKDMTGATRYEDFQSSKGKFSTTGSRVVVHSEQQHASDYCSASKTDRPELNQEYNVPDGIGPRERRRRERMAAEAKAYEENQPEPEKIDYTTTNSGAYQNYGRVDVKRVPRGRGGDRIRTGETLDLDVASMGKTKNQLNAEDEAIIKENYGGMNQPISVYSEKIRRGESIKGTAAGGVNPFGRSSAFTNDITDPTKRHVGASDFGGTEPVRMGPNLVQKSAFDQVRSKIVARGARGIKGLQRAMRIFDDNGDKQISKEEFADGLRDLGVDFELTPGTIDRCFAAFDTDGSGYMSFAEFLSGVRGAMNERRSHLVALAYDVLDVTGDGVVNYRDIERAYNTDSNPQVLSGEKSNQQVLEEFFDQWDTQDKDGVVTRREFEEYYQNISASIDDDDYFELMIRNAWHISGGDGWSANTTCRRVLVTHHDGTQEVCEIKNDIGLDPTDIEGMKTRLISQGVHNIRCISLAD